jgi:hypothetical protein
LSVVSVACGGGPAAPPRFDPTFTDGARLVARQVTYPGAPPVFAGIHDQTEGVACDFRAAGDGSLRCLPDDAAAGDTPERWVLGAAMPEPPTGQRLRRHEIHGADGSRFPDRWAGELYDDVAGQPCAADFRTSPDDGFCLPPHADIGAFFADTACSEPVAILWSSGPEPVVAVAPDGAVRAVSEPWTGATFYRAGTTCQELTVTGGTTRVYRVGEALPAGTVAPVQLALQGSGRLAAHVLAARGLPLTTRRFHLTSSYPSLQSAPYHDRDLGLACAPLTTAGQAILCLPADAAFDTRPDLLDFADPGCTQPVISLRRAFAIFAQADPAGPLVTEVHRVADTPSATGYALLAAGCTEYLKGAGYPVGDSVPLPSFASLTVSP